jgi:hypothetical protein
MAERTPGARLERILGEVDAQVQAAPVPSIPYARIEERVAARARARRRRSALLAGAVCGALLIGAVALWRSAAPARPAGFLIASASTDFRYHVDGGRLLVADAGQASLELKELGTRIVLGGGARVQREEGGVRVVRGTAGFEVEPRPAPSLVVYVSGGRIEVLGTRFTVVQGEDAGEVSLDRGTVRFRGADGSETVLRPGERLRWPPPPPVAPEPAPPAPEPMAPPPRSPPPPRPGVESRLPPAPAPAPALEPSEAVVKERRVLAEIDRLRMRVEDEALVRRLDELLSEDLGEPLRERVSFERCDLLAHRRGEQRRACEAIAQHLARYGGGEYAVRLRETQATLGCAP